jgi:hypothetical protein
VREASPSRQSRASVAANARARDPVADRRRRRGAGRRNRARLDSVSRGRYRDSRKTSAAGQRAGRAPTCWRRRTPCSAPPISNSTARAGEPTRFSVSYELTVFASTLAKSIRTRWSPVDRPRSWLPSWKSGRRISCSRDACACSRPGGGRRNQSLPDRAEAVRRGGPEFRGPARASIRPSPTSASYALHAGHADCGQQTLLLITLLRLNGIPARWQSGLDILRRRLRQHARLGLAVPGALRLGADGRHHRPLERTIPTCAGSTWAAPTPTASPSTTTGARDLRPGQTAFPFGNGRLAAREAEWTAATSISTSGTTTSMEDPADKTQRRLTNRR